jgi:uncharacterized protein YbjT (DUF2867 family)
MSEASPLSVVTGAYSFTGRYIARRLLDRGERVRTLTGHPDRDHPFGDSVPAFPYSFDDPGALAAALEGAETFYNTYWIRFEHGEATFDQALERTERLLSAARRAGVARVVHISTVHADPASPFPYFRAKGEAEVLIRESGLSSAILRPTVLFGAESVFFNNIAWALRTFPMFAVPGSGRYQVQPVYVDDVAELAIAHGRGEQGVEVTAAGAEIFAFDELLKLLAKRTGGHSRLLHVRPERALQMTKVIEGMVNDILLTRDEVDGLIRGLLVSEEPATGRTSFREWLERHGDELGASYFSELARHYR